MSRFTRWTLLISSVAAGVGIAAYVAGVSAPSAASVKKHGWPPVNSFSPGPTTIAADLPRQAPRVENTTPRLERQVGRSAAGATASDLRNELTDPDPFGSVSLDPPDAGPQTEPFAAAEPAVSEQPPISNADLRPAGSSPTAAPARRPAPAAPLPLEPSAIGQVTAPLLSPSVAPLPATAPVPSPVRPLPQPTAQSATPPTVPPVTPPVIEPLPEPSKLGITPAPGEGDDRLRVFFKDADIRDVLAGLSEQAGLNILPSKSVTGNVSASLNGVTVETALDAILKSTGYMARREGPFIYVGTPLDFDAMAHIVDTIGTRIYRPNYVTAQEIVALVTPILTPQIGKAVPSSPSKVDIPADSIKAGGNDFAGADAVLVQDYEAVLLAVDQVVAEIDQRPAQVGIDAMILSVRLNDTNTFGVDFQFLRNKRHLRFATGQPLQDIAQVQFDNGLKFAFLDSSLGAFLNALETIGDTNVIASPKLMVLNKHRAEILIGSQLGYVSTSQTETSTTQSVNFLEVGAQLRLRPFIANDGMIRMEIHPELSTGSVRVEGGFTLPDKDVTQVTTNIMVRDGYTVVIGGLMREDLTVTTNQVPVVGNLPIIGPLFRNKTEDTEKREILVLVTPHIMHEPGMYREGEQGAGEFHRRQQVYEDKMSPLGKRYLGRKYFRLAQEAWVRGDGHAALRLVSLSIQFDPLNRAAIDLRSDIWAGRHDGDHSGGGGVRPEMVPPGALDGHEISPFILEQLDQHGMPPASRRPNDQGGPGDVRSIEPYGPLP